MISFTSRREKRLWLWAVSAVVVIYSTLGLARTLANVLRDHGLISATFIVGFLLVLISVGTQALRVRPRGIEIGAALGIAAVYLMLLVRMTMAEERTHVFEYTVVALLVHEALLERASQGRAVPGPGRLAFVITAVVGIVDECLQAVIPVRVFDVRDILFNVLAAFMATTSSALLRWIRRRHE